MPRLVPCPACDGARVVKCFGDVRMPDERECYWCEGTGNEPDFPDDSGAQEHVVEPDLLAVFAEIGGAL